MTYAEIAEWGGLTQENHKSSPLHPEWRSHARRLSIVLASDLMGGEWVTESQEKNIEPCIINNRYIVEDLEGAGYEISGDLETWDFIVRHEVIANKLQQAISPLRTIMADQELRPRIRAERDEEGCQLLVLVSPGPDDNIANAISQMNSFCDDWWDKNMDKFGLTVLISIG